MKYRKMLIVFFISIIISYLMMCFNSPFATQVLAAGSSGSVSISDIDSKASSFISYGKSSAIDGMDESSLAADFIPLGKILVWFANATVAIVVVVMGVKYVTGNAEQQAKLKQQLIGLVVSVVVIYGAVGIWQIMKAIMNA